MQRATGDTTLNGSDWRFSSAQDALLVRQRVDGRIEYFEGQVWVPGDPPENSTEPIDLTPTTALDASVAAGSTVLPIAELDQDWAETLAGHLDAWFEAGATVVVAAGELTQVVRTVTSLGSLVLDQPLRFHHPEGTLVDLVPANLEDFIAEIPDRDGDGFTDAMELRMGTNPDNPDSVFRIDSASVTQNGAGVTITFPSRPGELYTVEYTDALNSASWTVETVVRGWKGETSTSMSHAILTDSPTGYYRVSFLE